MVKKHYTIIGIMGAVLLVAGFMYFSLGGASRSIQKVISNDGLAELEIPKNALPEGMSIKDISITNVSVDDTMIAYELKPDGATFSAPLTFKTTFKNRDNVIPIPFSISKENGIEPVNGAEVTLNLSKNETTVSAPVTHFSILTFPTRTARAFFSATMAIPDQVYVGDVVTAKVTLNKHTDRVVLFSELNPWAVPVYDDKERLILAPHNLGYKIDRDSVQVSGRAAAHESVGPRMSVDDRPALSSFVGESLSVKLSDFNCEKLGKGSITHIFEFTYNARAVDVTSDGSASSVQEGSTLGLNKFNKRGDGFIRVNEETECIARPSLPDNTGASVPESESKAVGDILDEGPSSAPVTPPPTTKPPGKGIVCGLPGGPACPPKK